MMVRVRLAAFFLLIILIILFRSCSPLKFFFPFGLSFAFVAFIHFTSFLQIS